MKKIVLAAMLMLSVAGAGWSFDPDNLNKVTITNSTTDDIQYLFAKAEDAGVWGADILGASNTLSPGNSHSFNILYINESARFTFLAIDVNDVSYQISDVTITDGTEVNLKFAAKNKISTKFDFTFTTVELTNTLDYDINYIFFSPSESDHWGADVMDAETILKKGTTASFLVPVKAREIKYNVMCADEDNDTYSFNVNLSNKKDTHAYDIEASDLDTDDD